ncbi:MAG: galactose oxidase [Verrucomicrobia bacterium]|nr:galactose oxidase [Verrucomicrobiota bacterium]
MKTQFHWQQLPPIPDREGFAAPIAGVSGGALIVAGGANFPDKKPWEGGKKIWYDTAFVLERPDGTWRGGLKLPRPNAYGVSLTTPDGIVCIGGADAQRHFNEVFLLRWNGSELTVKPLSSLPKPLANSCGALMGQTVYIAGGIETPDATRAMKNFWALDLSKPDVRWQELEPWPGPARMLAIAAVQDGSFFLASGTDLSSDAQGKPVRTYLKDGYRFTPGKGWKHIADLPHPTVAAPSPAPVADGKLLILGGDDGAQVGTPPTEHKGFPRDILAYDTKSGVWSVAGQMPVSRVTVPAVPWLGRTIIPNGEARPGVRSPEVWSLSAEP